MQHDGGFVKSSELPQQSPAQKLKQVQFESPR
jgi:hypothetical protein